MHALSTALAAVGWWLRAVVMYPVYVVTDVWHTLFNSPGSRGPRRSIGATLLDTVLTIPSLIWHYTYVAGASSVGMAQNWPRVMRLRDLAAGLPALLALGSVVMVFFFLPDLLHSKQEVTNSYWDAFLAGDKAARGKTEETERRLEHEKMLLYLRALSQINPDGEKYYQFHISQVYFRLGDIQRGEAIMQRLAPRDEQGFAPAHIWQAEQLRRQIPSDRVYRDAEAHLTRALASDENQAEVQFLLGRLYYEMYLNYHPQFSPSQQSRPALLDKAETHLLRAPQDNPQVALMLGRVHARQGKTELARRDIASLAASYQHVLKTKPDDIETRLRLAVAHREINDFDAAIQTLQAGITLKPDVRLDHELSVTFFMMAHTLQQKTPNSLAAQYMALSLGYLAYSPSVTIAARFVQGLVGSAEEAALARQTLVKLAESPEAKARSAHGMASFLLGFDAQRRSLVVDARRYFDEARKINDDRIPHGVADLALANLQHRSDLLDVATAIALTDSALLVWPENSGLLMVRGWNEMQRRNFGAALGSFTKALKYRPDDSALHALLSETYSGLQQTANADKHLNLHLAAKAREQEAEKARTPQSVVVTPPPVK